MTRNVLVGSPTGTVRHVWDVFGHIIADVPYGGTGSREYVWLGDMPLTVFDTTASPATQAYVHVDHLDRPVAMTDASKATTWSATYEPFGKVASISGSATQNLGLPGQWFQLEAGLAYNWNRHYDPTLGRYIQPDPLRFADGPSVFGYAGQSSMMRVDPSGLQMAGGLGCAWFGLGCPPPAEVCVRGKGMKEHYEKQVVEDEATCRSLSSETPEQPGLRIRCWNNANTRYGE